MALQAELLADNVPAPIRYGRHNEPGRIRVAVRPYHVPVFWLFCFDPGDLTEVPGPFEEDGPSPHSQPR